VLVLGLPALTACGGWASDRPLTVAVVLAVDEAQGWSIEQGVAVGMEEVAGVLGGQAGFKVWRSPRSSEKITVELTKWLAAEEVDGLIVSPRVDLAMAVVRQAGDLPQVTLCGDPQVGDQGGRDWCRMAPGYLEEAEAVFRGLNSGMVRREWWILVSRESDRQDLEEGLAQVARDAGVEATLVLGLDREMLDASACYRRLPEGWPDGILIWLDPAPTAYFAKYLRCAGFAGIIAGLSTSHSETFALTVGSSRDGCVFPEPAGLNRDGEMYLQFVRRYRQRTGGEPDLMAALARDAAWHLAGVIGTRAGNVAAAKFREHAGVGVTGLLGFGEGGGRRMALRLVACAGGVWRGHEHDHRSWAGEAWLPADRAGSATEGP
jgi:ABC-type branched-subunit amino acid transport system substrate-binding protein